MRIIQARYWHKADIYECAANIALGRKADMGFCRPFAHSERENADVPGAIHTPRHAKVRL
jgi:hypothetical protein